MLVLTNVPQTSIKLGQRISGLTGCFHFQLLELKLRYIQISQFIHKVTLKSENRQRCTCHASLLRSSCITRRQDFSESRWKNDQQDVRHPITKQCAE